MRVFLTGATGFIGSRVVKDLIGAGHQVLGLARSEAGAKALTAAGAEVQGGSLEDLDVLKTGAKASDAVIHCGFNHDFANFMENCQIDKRAIEALGSALAGSNRTFIVTSGLAGLGKPGQLATEESVIPADFHLPRVSEQTALAQIPLGVCSMVMRLPQVHNTEKAGLVTYAIAQARAKGVSPYVGEGSNHWAAAHVDDVARLYLLALEKPEAGARWHAVAEEGVRFKDIAEAIGKGLKVEVVSITAQEATAHFGWWGMLASGELTGSSTLTQQKLAWKPTGPGLLADLQQTDFSKNG